MFSRRNILLLLIFLFINSDLFMGFVKEYETHKFLSYLDKLDDYDNCERTESISGLKICDNISNKGYIIDRINNASYKVHKDGIPKRKDYSGFFVHNEYNDVDYIILDTMELPSLTLYHEIGHLIDKHKELETEVSISEIRKDSISVVDFIDFYSGFPDISIGNNTFLFGYIVYEKYMSHESYYGSDNEIYARLFSYHNFCYIYDIGSVEELKEILLKSYNIADTNMAVVSLQTLDFLYVLPVINFEKEEKIKLLF